MKKRNVRVLAAAALLVVLGAASFALWRHMAGQPAQTQLAAAGELTVLAAIDEDIANYLCEGFAQQSQSKVSVVCLPQEQAVALLLSGQAQADVFLGGTAQSHRQLKDAGMLQRSAVDEGNLARFYVDLEQTWVPVAVELFSIGIHTDAAQGLELPQTLEQLTQPQYRGLLVMADPTTSYTGLTLPYSILRVYGQQQGMVLLEALWSNVGEFAQTDLVAAQKGAQGVYPFVLGTYSDQRRMVQAGYSLSTVVYPGAGWTVSPLSILANAENTPLARAFQKFCLMPDVLKTVASLGQGLSPLTDAPVTIQDYPISGAARVNSDYSKHDAVMQLYRDVVARNPQLVFPVSRAPLP